MAHAPRLAVTMLTGLLGLASPAPEARAASLSVNPTKVQLSKQQPSMLLTLRNEGTTATRLQVTAHKWNQSLTGEMELQPTTDLVFFPSLMVLEPGQSRSVRIGTTTPFTASERSYRIFVEELPPPDNKSGQASAVRMYTRLGIPVFLQPDHAEPRPGLAGVAVADGALTFRITNAGTQHFVPTSVVVRGLAGNGEPALEERLNSWYVLAGGAREFTVPLDSPECSRIRSLVVEAQVDERVLREQLATPHGTCRP
ncbi:MAG TPA: fimbria/pilus periplasmic chaperone [Vicinamibacterales bacterium]|nr:fimbria/pilus periplasmic chaperone [Vicinamibacterales bacterium]